MKPHKMFKTIMAAGVFLAAVTLPAGSGLAQEPIPGDALLPKWKEDHRRYVKELIRSHVVGASDAELQRLVFEVTRVEVNMATTGARDRGPVYTGAVSPEKHDRIPAEVLRIYFMYKGIKLDTSRFFEGKKVQYFVENTN